MAYQKLQANRAAAVTPSDTVDIPSISTDPGAGRNNGCVLYVGAAGNLILELLFRFRFLEYLLQELLLLV